MILNPILNKLSLLIPHTKTSSTTFNNIYTIITTPHTYIVNIIQQTNEIHSSIIPHPPLNHSIYKLLHPLLHLLQETQDQPHRPITNHQSLKQLPLISLIHLEMMIRFYVQQQKDTSTYHSVTSSPIQKTTIIHESSSKM